MAKRFFDIILALVLSVFLLPILLVLMLAVFLLEGRPVFYVSERMRSPGRSFSLWKLRTMRDDASDTGVTAGHKATRVTRVGRFLRKTHGDEIPQLWNVLKGDMSFVGPRPPLKEVVERFPALYGEVLRCRPGITGLATIVFHRHEEWLLADCASAEEAAQVYDRVCVPRKAHLDMIYQKQQSMCLDLWIIGKTAAGVVKT